MSFSVPVVSSPGAALKLSSSIAAAKSAVRAALPPSARPTVGLVLGSGLGDYADTLSGAHKISYADLPGFPLSRVPGHAGNLVFGSVATEHPGKASANETSANETSARDAGSGRVEVLAMQGRVHAYEGHDLATVVFPIRVLIACGCKTLIVTNAAGGIGADLSQGQLVLIRDHLNLMGGSPLRGDNDPDLGPRFPDMSAVYDPALREIAASVGRGLGVALASGVYAGCLGPQYETPAEVRMLRLLGADLVGMSTVPEAIAARHMGARVLGISCVTNLAAGMSAGPLSHDEVTQTAARVRGDFVKLLDGILQRLATGAVVHG